jgi:general secretion pathway protein I
MRRAAPPLSRGFTLIEVLVSLAIFALAAVVLSVGYLNIIGSYRAMANRHQAEEDWKWVRSTVLAEPERTKVESGGHLTLADGHQVTWSAKIESAGVADLFHLTLVAEATGSGSQDTWKRSESIHLLRPAWSDPTERDQLRDQTKQRVQRETGT